MGDEIATDFSGLRYGIGTSWRVREGGMDWKTSWIEAVQG